MTPREYLNDWYDLFDMNIVDSILNRLNILYQIHNVYPYPKDIFKAFRLCPLKTLNVVFLCQDPYPQPNVATGIALANKNDCKSLSPSLQVVKNSLQHLEDSENPINFDTTLESWEEQGILMLNTALTVEQNSPNSHSLLWRPFIISLLNKLSNYSKVIIYVLMGKNAQDLESYIKSSVPILKTNHPAYYARKNELMPCELFKDINNLLIGIHKKEIQWYN